MKLKHIILLLFVVGCFSATASDIDSAKVNSLHQLFNEAQLKRKGFLKNPRKQRPVGMNVHVWGVGGFGALSVDGFITPNIAAEAGVGIKDFDGSLAYFLGARYHLLGKTPIRLTPYAGIYTAANFDEQRLAFHSVYIPAGIHRIKKSGFNWALEIAFEQNTFKTESVSGSFKIGYRF